LNCRSPATEYGINSAEVSGNVPHSCSLLKTKGYDAPLSGPEFTEADWQTAAAVWEVAEGEEPVLAFKYIDMSGVAKFIKVER
jgi:hypothetical protein